MESTAPKFRAPEYEAEDENSTHEPIAPEEVSDIAETRIAFVPQSGGTADTDLENIPPEETGHLESTKNVHVSPKTEIGASPPSYSKSDHSKNKSLDDKINKVSTETDSPPNNHHLKFTDTAKHAAGHVSRKLHLHRETARGPSEARPRRQSMVVPADKDVHLPFYVRLRNAVFGSLIMFTTFPYWDMGFWSGWAYTWGSILFVIDGFWAWTPLRWPQSAFKGEAEYGVGLLFFFGAIFYQLGATMAYLEAINDGSFGGSAMKRHLEGHDEDAKRLLDDKLHLFFGHMIPHHHHHDDDGEDDETEKRRNADVEPGRKLGEREQGSAGEAGPPRRGGVDMGSTEEGEFHEYLTWRWWPTWHALHTHHIRDMGYIACVIQLLGATLYGICGVESIPGILSNFTPSQAIHGYWIPQTIASVCFLTAGVMFTLITQEKWYKPLPYRIAWWIGVWATIGSVGFLLSAAFGIRSGDSTGAAYQSSLSSTWGSIAYLTSSWLQWYESVNNGPVLAFPNNRIPTVMRDKAHGFLFGI
ncbi:hypothetical protein EJ08DRAFT_400562 [Tothia fuscella]|uniref:Integral membrane protein n=1 Tax=Tothia fuscella TaxID=1048955 RepID=A0A9P4NKT8_9PEZI|nr:hypothetical protein EJ08DRAFT_400562 [Tothia fuscella]